MNIICIILAVLGVINALIALALCRASGEADRRAEEMTKEREWS